MIWYVQRNKISRQDDYFLLSLEYKVFIKKHWYMRVSTSLFQAIRSFIVCLLFLSLHQLETKNQMRNTKFTCFDFCWSCNSKTRRHPGLFSFRITTTTNIEKKIKFGIWFLVTGSTTKKTFRWDFLHSKLRPIHYVIIQNDLCLLFVRLMLFLVSN